MSDWYVLEKEETERLTANISQRTGNRLERRVEQRGEKSMIVAEALQMYLCRGDLARIEQKLNLVLAERQVPYRGPSPEIPDEEHGGQPHGLTDTELRQLAGVMGKANAASVQTQREANTDYRLQVKLPQSLVKAVYEHVDGKRYIGEKIVGPALREWFEYGGWINRIEEKLDLLMGDHDLPQPARSKLATQVANKMEHVDHDRYYDTVSVSVLDEDERNVDVSSLHTSDRVQVDPDEVNLSKVPHQSREQAGVITAVFRHEFANDRSKLSIPAIEHRVNQHFDVHERTRDKIVHQVLEQLREEYYAEPLLRYAMDVSERDVLWFPKLPMASLKHESPLREVDIHRAAASKAEDALRTIIGLKNIQNPTKRQRRMREEGVSPNQHRETIDEYQQMRDWAKEQVERYEREEE